MNDKQWGFAFSLENCIQCHGCEIACKSWRSVELGVKWRRVENIWSGSYPEITSSSASISCQHCCDPACIIACPTGAISKRPDDGAVLVERDLCTGCQACFAACPYHVPQFGADGIMQKCDLCTGLATGGNEGPSAPPCVRTCPTQALELREMSAIEKTTQEILLLKG